MIKMSDASHRADNLLLVSYSREPGDPALILEEKHFSYFRACPQGMIFLGCPPTNLSQNDIETLNTLCDTDERPLNRRIKKILARSLTAYFGKMSFHVSELGCGRFPLIKYFPEELQVSYQGIERDRNYLTELHKMQIPSSDWPVALSQPVPAGKHAVCVAVYALHFMVSAELPVQIAHLTSEYGFFVGNFFVDPAERDSNEQRNRLGEIIRKAGMSYLTIQDPRSKANEFWMIGRAGDVTSLHNYAGTLQNILYPGKGGPSVG